jgi:hypothetical protein
VADHIWTGLIEVHPMTGVDPFDGAPGAYVYAAAEAIDGTRFAERVRLAAHTPGVRVVEIEDASPALASGIRAPTSDQRRLISDARESSEVVWGTFHAYENEDE